MTNANLNTYSIILVAVEAEELKGSSGLQKQEGEWKPQGTMIYDKSQIESRYWNEGTTWKILSETGF